jgi:gamma-glutamyltranspeptidase
MIQRLLVLLLLILPVSVRAAGGVLSTASPLASEAGREILREGGSAADAAMAVMVALTVVEPQSSGIGGGGFLIYNDGKTGRVATIDGRETAPANATPSPAPSAPRAQPRWPSARCFQPWASGVRVGLEVACVTPPALGGRAGGAKKDLV